MDRFKGVALKEFIRRGAGVELDKGIITDVGGAEETGAD
jgi:hypothetical protein